MHAFGAVVRLESGELASAPVADVNANRATYERALSSKDDLPFDAHPGARHKILLLAKTRADEPIDPTAKPPLLYDELLEEQIANYLKETAQWEQADAPPAHQRHFLRKKRRADAFEARPRQET
ncbi:MAG: hypothetical protein M3Y21_04015 [Candidatus Eremiobacteraeota bacterium]|nr:hypothetical protein [Candidatus Eremiobacteraeota bacterium]